MAQLMLINPKRRTRKKTASRKRRTVRRNPVAVVPKRRRRSAVAVRRAVRRIRRNPVSRLSGGIMGDIMDAAIGAGGAVAVNTVYDLLPLPLSMKTGMSATIGKAATAVALGMLGKRVLGRTAGKMAAGALTVIAYDVIKGMVPAPGAVAGMGYMSPALSAGYLPNSSNGMNGTGEYIDTGVFSTGMGEYVY